MSARKPEVIEIEIARTLRGAATNVEDVVRSVRNSLEENPPPPGSAFRFLGMTFDDVDTLCDAILALESLWK